MYHSNPSESESVKGKAATNNNLISYRKSGAFRTITAAWANGAVAVFLFFFCGAQYR